MQARRITIAAVLLGAGWWSPGSPQVTCKETFTFESWVFARPGVEFLLGDGFVANGGTISVGLVGHSAAWTGRLSFLDPVTAESIPLFTNQECPANTPCATAGKTVTRELGVFPRGAPIVFEYKNIYGGSGTAITGERTLPMYTGPNDSGTYDFTSDPFLRGLAIEGEPKPVSERVNPECGNRRWAIAGRTHRDTVEFRFEDKGGGGNDYNDILFWVSGVALNSEVKLGTPTVRFVGPMTDSTAGIFEKSVGVELTPSTGQFDTGAILYYTIDGSEPVIDSGGNPLGTTRRYSSIFQITETVTVRAFAWKPAEEAEYGIRTFKSSGTLTVRLTKNPPTLKPPIAVPGGQAFVGTGIEVELRNSDPSEAGVSDIYYRLCGDSTDCTLDTTSGTKYTGPFTISPESGLVLRARCRPVSGGESKPSSAITEIYAAQLPRPVATPGGTSFTGSLSVTLTVQGIDDAEIRYTLDGSLPETDAAVYTGPVTLSSDATLTAVTVKNGYITSAAMRETYTRNPRVEHAYYLDRNADGNIDEVVLGFDMSVPGPPSRVDLTEPGSAGGQRAFDRIRQGQTASTFIVDIDPPFSFGTGPAAGRGALPAETGFDTREFTVADSAAPVIARASFRPGRTVDQTTRLQDTLIVAFSEPARVVKTGTVRAFQAEQDGTLYTFEVQVLEHGRPDEEVFLVGNLDGVDYPADGDSIWIVPGEIADFARAQANPANRRVPLDVRYPEVFLNYAGAPNPFTPRSSRAALPPTVLTALRNDASAPDEVRNAKEGFVLVISPSSSLPSVEFHTSGEATIYDCTGNVVSSIPLVKGEAGKQYMVWDGTNRRGRIVGTGTYMALVTIRAASIGTVVKQFRIGVGR